MVEDPTFRGWYELPRTFDMELVGYKVVCVGLQRELDERPADKFEERLLCYSYRSDYSTYN